MKLFEKLKDNILPLNRRVLKKELQRSIDEKFDMLLKKASMTNDIWQINNIQFFVPNYPFDAIQKIIVNSNNFYEQDILEDLNQFLPSNAIICDIGANIGNHTLYWLFNHKADFIYCFEPRLETFNILEKNIEINQVKDKTQCFNFALSDNSTKLSVQSFSQDNIGANFYCKNPVGNIKALPLDEIEINKKIDFMKIDVEGMEIDVLAGAENTIKKYTPVIFIEIFYENYHKVNYLLEKLGYSMIKEYPNSNYLYIKNN